jgi:hypothetical protein
MLGAGLGLLGGALLGAAIGATQEFCIFQCSSAAPIGALVGAPVGLAIGGLIGVATESTRWRRWGGNDVAVHLRAGSGGFGLAMEVRF